MIRFFLLSVLSFFWYNSNAQLRVFKKEMFLMGCSFEVGVVHNDSMKAFESIAAAEQEMRRIEYLLSDWKSETPVSAINRNAGLCPVKVPLELFELIQRCIRMSEITMGAFDITFAGMDKIWHFDGSMKKMPSESEIKESVAHVGYRKMVLNKQDTSVFLPEAGMKIGFGGVGQGYAARMAKVLLLEMGIGDGVINASGEPTAWGHQPDGKEWVVGVKDPAKPDQIAAWLSVSDLTVATSGNYEKFVEFNGVRYGHILHPATGYPALGLTSVTIICPDPEIADALSTAAFVLGETEGMKLINRMKQVHAFFYTTDHRLVTSQNIQLHPIKP